MAGRFSGANNIDEYWHNLRQGINSIEFLTDAELEASGVNKGLIRNPNYVRAYSSFDHIESFDADFFGYSPLEAEIIAPQHRIFLESAWTALETATVNLADYLKQNPDIDLADVAYTLQVGRKAFDYRRMVVCQDAEDAIAKLTTYPRNSMF